VATLDIAIKLLTKAQNNPKQISAMEFRSWITNSLSKGGKEVHRWTTGTTKAPPLPARVFSDAAARWLYKPQDKADHWAAQFGEIWHRDRDKLSDIHSKIRGMLIMSTTVDYEPLDEHHIAQALVTISTDTALGADWLDIWWVKQQTQSTLLLPTSSTLWSG